MWRSYQRTPNLLEFLQAPGVIAHLEFGVRYRAGSVPARQGRRYTILVQVPGSWRWTVVAAYFTGKVMDRVGILEADRKQRAEIKQFGFAICSGWVTPESLAEVRAKAIEKKAEVAARKAEAAARKVAKDEDRIRRFGINGKPFL